MAICSARVRPKGQRSLVRAKLRYKVSGKSVTQKEGHKKFKFG